MSKPRLLDLYCKAGGAARGYQQAGFYVIGVDIEPQPNYCGDEFIRADALDFPIDFVRPDAVHASPPCQAYTSLRGLGKGAGVGAPMLIEPTRDLLRATGLPYVIENVMGAPLKNAVRLCGSSFGLGVRRHRLFECNFPVMVMPCGHTESPRPIAVYGDHPEDSKRDNLNRARTLAEGQEAMGIDWMPWKQLTQAIPPAMTRFLGEQLMTHLNARAAA